MEMVRGTRLGPYEILAPIGSGGMGDVYRGLDTRLNRQIAIKVLSATVTSDSTKRQRFEREAQAIATLSHPHICSVFDVGSQDGVEFLVMEHLDGETLDRRLLRGVLPMEDVLRYAIEIAAALDHAHRHGIVHRDLKPTNIMLTSAGAKLLDFGLARWHDARSVRWGADSEAAPPETQSLTAEGTIVGTLQYMAPEQVEGMAADARADLFAFGAIVYEMATGRKTFTGASHAGLIAAILTSDPSPMSSIDLRVPSGLERIVRKCLAKDPELRWQTARDLVDELKWIAEDGPLDARAAQESVPRANQQGPRAFPVWLAISILASIAVIAVSVLAWQQFQQRPTTDSPTVQFTIAPPEGWAFNESSPFVALSPDGRSLLLTATSGTGDRALWVRSLDSAGARLIAGTEGGLNAFWSPDSQSILFRTADQGWRKVDAAGGPPRGLPTVFDAQQGTTNRDGVLIFTPRQGFLSGLLFGPGPGHTGLLYRPAASAVEPTALTALDESLRETAHEWPHFLPDGRHFLFVARARHPDHDGILYAGSLESSTRVRLVKVDSHAVYAWPGYLVYMLGNAVVAQPFDAERLRVTGEPERIAERVDRDGISRRGAFTVSQTGVLAYHPAGEMQLVWHDRAGVALKAIGAGTNPAISPDGRRVVVSRRDQNGSTSSLWMIDVPDGTVSRFTSGTSGDDMPLWSPDGRRVLFKATRGKGPGIFQKPSDSEGSEEVVLATDGESPEPGLHPLGWTRDGRSLIYAKSRPLANPGGGTTPRPVGPAPRRQSKARSALRR